MNKLFRFQPARLLVQLVFSFVVLAILSTAAVGLPAIWLIRQQFDRQARAIVEQGARTTGALMTARQEHLTNIANLTTQRPSLLRLLQENNLAELGPYLDTLKSNAKVDALVICSADGTEIAYSGSPTNPQICRQLRPSLAGEITYDGPFVDVQNSNLWLLSSQILQTPEGDSAWEIVAGQLVQEAFAVDLGEQAGIAQLFLLNGQVIASSEAGHPEFRPASSDLRSGSEPAHTTLTWNGELYYGLVLPWADIPPQANGATLQVESIVALPVGEFARAQAQLTFNMVASMLVVMALGSLLGVLLSRRVSLPLARLAQSATALRKGNLDAPVPRGSQVREVERVARTLEDARVTLQHSLSQLRQEKDWIAHLLESIVEGIITLDGYGRVTYFSPGAERITGWKQGQVVGKTADDVFQVTDDGTLQSTNTPGPRFSALIPQPGRVQKIPLTLRSGRQVTLAVTGASLAPPEAGKARVALVLRDVSDEEAMHRLLGDFLANIAHEFRTPLSALAASIELLLDQLGDLSQEELQELLNSLYLGTLSLQTLIDNLLEGASIETGRFRVTPRPADLETIVGEAVDSMNPLMEKYGQQLRLSIPENLPLVQADARRTVQVLVNLLSNAVKHNPSQGEIRLTVQRILNAVRVTVADDGPGIPPQHLSELFRRFGHLGTGTPQAEHGAGLGLSVVKAIVEAQGGAAGAENCTPKGAAFWFTIPVVDIQAGDDSVDSVEK